MIDKIKIEGKYYKLTPCNLTEIKRPLKKGDKCLINGETCIFIEEEVVIDTEGLARKSMFEMYAWHKAKITYFLELFKGEDGKNFLRQNNEKTITEFYV